VVAETETSRCGDGAAGGGFTFREGEVWTARDGVLARFVRFSARGPENRKPICLGGTAYVKPGAAVAVALRCSDPDGDAVTVQVTAQPALGALTVDAEGTGRYTAGAARGDDTIRFRARDGRDWSDEAVLTVRVDDLAPVCQSRRDDYRVPFQTQVRLQFETLEEAETYARANGIPYTVQPSHVPTPKRTSYPDNFRSDRKTPWTH
jgi:hypothetical protein